MFSTMCPTLPPIHPPSLMVLNDFSFFLSQYCGTHHIDIAIIQSNVFVKPFLHQLMSQSVVQKPSLKPQTASNAGLEARLLGKTT